MSKWPNSDNAKPYNSNTGEMRDIFAGLALHALLIEGGFTSDIGKRAYEIADHMLEERDK